MLAKPGQMPTRAEDYAYEFKWDGYRTLLFADKGRAHVLSRRVRDVTGEFPELQEVAAALPRKRVILDGEIVVLDEQGRPSFERLQGRAGFHAPKDAASAPVVFLAFDLLWQDGRSLLREPYTVRRAALEKLGLKTDRAWVPPAYDDGAAVLQASRDLGLEGVLAKRRTSLYEAGQRSGAWVKVKLLKRQEFVVGGYTPGEGARGKSLGALLVGYYEDGALRFAGRVGTGFTEAMLKHLLAELAKLRVAKSPFAPNPLIPKDSVFVQPKLVAEVAFAEWTRDGVLRQPSFQGLRSDKAPDEVVKEVA